MNLGPSLGYVSYGGEILGPQCVYPPLPRSPTWGVSAIVCSRWPCLGLTTEVLSIAGSGVWDPLPGL